MVPDPEPGSGSACDSAVRNQQNPNLSAPALVSSTCCGSAALRLVGVGPHKCDYS